MGPHLNPTKARKSGSKQGTAGSLACCCGRKLSKPGLTWLRVWRPHEDQSQTCSIPSCLCNFGRYYKMPCTLIMDIPLAKLVTEVVSPCNGSLGDATKNKVLLNNLTNMETAPVPSLCHGLPLWLTDKPWLPCGRLYPKAPM